MLYCDRIGVSEGIDVIRQANQKSAIFVTFGNFQINRLIFNCKFAMHLMINE